MEVFVPPCVSTPEFIHAAMRPDVITETVVEVSTEDSEPMDTSPIPTSPDSHEPMKKKKGKVHQFLRKKKIIICICCRLQINVISTRYSQFSKLRFQFFVLTFALILSGSNI